ncbi:double-strand-break repair protein rad21-like protein 1 [Strix aluco]|uniref:double-strand-break repair protein rad21-like protein 1 n=1 Tax=Strix aluco TaxID=111821 RepID=UPI003DA376EF
MSLVPGAMFYMHLLVNKRGPLAKIWLAAHWERKLTKAHIFECNLETTVEKLISPKFTVALRTSGHLLLGVVRIYHRKAKYLLADCSEALTKMKTAFRPGLVDLPEENVEAAYQSITLPEEFHDFETPLPDLNAIDVAEHFALNQSRAEDITFTEDYESNMLLCDRNFDEEPEALRKQSFFDSSILMSSNSLVADHNSASVNGGRSALREDAYSFEHDCFGDEQDAADMIEILLRDEQNGLDKDIPAMEEKRPLSQDPSEIGAAIEADCADTTIKKISHLMNETILLLKEDEGFVLEPVDDTAVTQRKKNKRKRKLLVDVDKELSCNTIYNQLNNCMDILATLDLAPPTKKTMMWKKSGGVDKLLSHATQPVVHTELQRLFVQCFKNHGFKMRRNGIQREMEETRKEHDTTEMLRVEEPSYLQESAHSETERKIRNDSFMLTSQNNRNETDDNCGETIQGGTAFSESSSPANTPRGPEAGTQQVEFPKVRLLEADNPDLFRGGLCSFSEILKKKKKKQWHHELTVNFGVLTSSLVHIWPVKNFIAWYVGIRVSQTQRVCGGSGSLLRQGEPKNLKPNFGTSFLAPDQYESCQNPGQAEQYLAVTLPPPGSLGPIPQHLAVVVPGSGKNRSVLFPLKELMRNGRDSEEIKWNKITLQLLKTLQHLKRSGVRAFSFRELCRKNNRKEAAAKFYIFLVLKKQSVVELSQSAPFADITATLGPMFSAPEIM